MIVRKRVFFIVLISLINIAAIFPSGSKDKKVQEPPDDVYIAARALDNSYKPREVTGEIVPFIESWGWVLQGREYELSKDAKLTDIGYFAADIDTYGHLAGAPKRSSLKKQKARVHLVLVCDSKSLTHFVLSGAPELRDILIDDIMSASLQYDGVQVDYELIPAKDIESFIAFLTELSKRVHKAGKIFSVCVPARTRLLKGDAFPYAQIADISDRVMIMAYDEHWSTSKPGPIASVAWCRNVAKYAITVIPESKLVMGLPFYGRTWANERPAQGWYHSGIGRILRQYEHDEVRYINDIPSAHITMKVNVTCYFEDAYSTVTKLRLYSTLGVKNVAFWRIGQEDQSVWRWMKLVDSDYFAPKEIPPIPSDAPDGDSTPTSQNSDSAKSNNNSNKSNNNSTNRTGEKKELPKDFIIIDSSKLNPRK